MPLLFTLLWYPFISLLWKVLSSFIAFIFELTGPIQQIRPTCLGPNLELLNQLFSLNRPLGRFRLCIFVFFYLCHPSKGMSKSSNLSLGMIVTESVCLLCICPLRPQTEPRKVEFWIQNNKNNKSNNTYQTFRTRRTG